MRLLLAGIAVGVATCVALLIGVAMVAWVDELEQGWESDHYHPGPTMDPPDSHQEDGPP